MKRELAMKVADAVMYEGYMLYPYRPSSLKNQQRWSFGILYPPAYGEVALGTERANMHSECLLRFGGESITLHIQLRFLQLLGRTSQRVEEGQIAPTDSTWEGDSHILAGEDVVERSVEIKVLSQAAGLQSFPFRFDGLGQPAGEVINPQHSVEGMVQISSQLLRSDVIKLSIDVDNGSPLATVISNDREAALKSSFLSAHTILSVEGGEFISLLDPPSDLRDAAAGCKNLGNFPVLVGAESDRDMLLCSPILLYDYPQIAPESAGDFCDATEMDEMLTLRILTMTDDEKGEMSLANDKARELLRRTEQSAREQLMRTHGTIRSMRPVSDDQ